DIGNHHSDGVRIQVPVCKPRRATSHERFKIVRPNKEDLLPVQTRARESDVATQIHSICNREVDSHSCDLNKWIATGRQLVAGEAEYLRFTIHHDCLLHDVIELVDPQRHGGFHCQTVDADQLDVSGDEAGTQTVLIHKHSLTIGQFQTKARGCRWNGIANEHMHAAAGDHLNRIYAFSSALETENTRNLDAWECQTQVRFYREYRTCTNVD